MKRPRLDATTLVWSLDVHHWDLSPWPLVISPIEGAQLRISGANKGDRSRKNKNKGCQARIRVSGTNGTPFFSQVPFFSNAIDQGSDLRKTKAW